MSEIKKTHKDILNEMYIAKDFAGVKKYSKALIDEIISLYLYEEYCYKNKDINNLVTAVMYNMESSRCNGTPEMATQCYEEIIDSESVKIMFHTDLHLHDGVEELKNRLNILHMLDIMYMAALADLRLWGHALTVLEKSFSQITNIITNIEDDAVLNLDPIYHKFFSLAGLILFKNKKNDESKVVNSLNLNFFKTLRRLGSVNYSKDSKLDLLFLHTIIILRDYGIIEKDYFAEFKKMNIILEIDYDNLNYNQKGFYQFIKNLVIKDEVKELECLSKSAIYMQLDNNPLNIAISQYRLSIQPLYKNIKFQTKPKYDKIKMDLINISGCQEDDTYDNLETLCFIRPMIG